MAFIPTPLPTSVDTVTDFATSKARTQNATFGNPSLIQLS